MLVANIQSDYQKSYPDMTHTQQGSYQSQNNTKLTRLAIMQPYFFPYIGYWQLIKSANRFVILDDVNYIQRGWINRNRILVNDTPTYITLPLQNSSQNKKIFEIRIDTNNPWRSKILKTLQCTYKKSEYYDEVYETIEQIINFNTESLSEFLSNQIKIICDLLKMDTEIVSSSRIYSNNEIKSEERIIDICKKNYAHTYLNLPGGRTIYNQSNFTNNGISLQFISTNLIPYLQRNAESFAPNLSIIDVLMNSGIEGVMEHVNAYDLVS